MKNNFTFPVKDADSPWGSIQDVDIYSNDVICLETASHGGFWVSKKAYSMMPKKYRDCSMTNNNYFEEDCSWCGVVLSFPDLFKPHHIKGAEMTFLCHYKKKA